MASRLTIERTAPTAKRLASSERRSAPTAKRLASSERRPSADAKRLASSERRLSSVEKYLYLTEESFSSSATRQTPVERQKERVAFLIEKLWATEKLSPLGKSDSRGVKEQLRDTKNTYTSAEGHARLARIVLDGLLSDIEVVSADFYFREMWKRGVFLEDADRLLGDMVAHRRYVRLPNGDIGRVGRIGA